MAGYTRQDTLNNIADGNIINASDFDNEYDAIEAAFSAVSGHTHDGTAAEGAAITKVGPNQDIVVSASSVLPKTDNTLDLGSSSFEFKDLYIDGTANIDSLVADTADINAGTIDGVVIGGSSAGAGAFTTLMASGDVSFDGGTFVFNEAGADRDARFEGDGDPNLLFLDASTDRVGIGTNTPAAKLDVNGASNLGGNIQTISGSTIFNSTGDLYVRAGTSGALRLGSDGSNDRAVLDSSGNLGLGVTPSAWWSSTPAYQVLRASLWGAANNAYVGSNYYYDGANRRYIGSDFATEYGQLGGQHIWYTAPSGTAGNAISFTQAMTLDASGNLAVGRIAVQHSAKLNVLGTGSSSVPTNLSDLSGALMLVESAKAGTGYGGVGYVDSGGGGAAVVFGRGGSYDTQILFCTNPLGTNTAGAMTERARITSGGNLLVGTTSGTYRLSAAVDSGADRDILLAGVNGVTNGLHVQWNHATSKTHVRIADIPTSAAGLPAGTLWNDGGTLKIA